MQTTTHPLEILVVDDDRVIQELCRAILQREGYQVRLVGSGEEALELLKTASFPIILSDIHMFETDGLALLSHLKKSGADSMVILMTGYGCLEDAISAIHEGAFDYISKPLKMNELTTLIRRAANQWQASKASTASRSKPSAELPRTLIGKSPQIVQVYKILAKATLVASNVLIVGESGTGKELVARAIHSNSERKDKAFVTVNCGALAENLLESELFGHVKGAFTGAIASKRGLFEEANGGTIFLDEIGDISLNLQVKLLRVIQEGELKPVGTNETRRVDTRVIAATHRDLEKYVREGKFREDLYYRLKVFLIDLPPLRQRPQDLPQLAYHFLALYAERSNKDITRISDEAMQLLQAYSWPGNVRELEHAIERAVAMSNTHLLYIDDFPSEIVHFGAEKFGQVIEMPPQEAEKSLEQIERAHILRVLNEVAFNKSKAAGILGIDRATLYRKAHRYGIRLGDEKMGAGK